MSDVEPDDDAPDESGWWGKFAAGLALTLVLDAASVGIAWLSGVLLAAAASASPDLAGLGMVVSYGWTMLFGVLQVVYVGPVAGFLWVSDQKALATGVVAGAAVAFLLSGVFYGCLLGLMGGAAAYCATVPFGF